MMEKELREFYKVEKHAMIKNMFIRHLYRFVQSVCYDSLPENFTFLQSDSDSGNISSLLGIKFKNSSGKVFIDDVEKSKGVSDKLKANKMHRISVSKKVMESTSSYDLTIWNDVLKKVSSSNIIEVAAKIASLTNKYAVFGMRQEDVSRESRDFLNTFIDELSKYFDPEIKREVPSRLQSKDIIMIFKKKEPLE